MLRVYSAAHGLTSQHNAVVEVGADEIILRVDTRWMRFTHVEQQSSNDAAKPFSLNEDGTVTLASQTEEMDLTAERVTRELMSAA
jgi:hypothetical protein